MSSMVSIRTCRRRFLKMRTLRTILISIESHPNMKFEIYERLNTGSISLNAQELRNSIYRGPFNDLLHELAKQNTFRALIGTKTPRKRMVDEEAILRFVAMRARLGVYRTPLKKFLNEYMGSERNMGLDRIAELKAIFQLAVNRAQTLLGGSAFRILDPHGAPLEAAVNRAVLEAQLLAFSWLVPESNPDPAKVKKEIARLFRNEQFADAVQRATGDRSRTLQRVRDTVAALERAGGRLQIQHNLQD